MSIAANIFSTSTDGRCLPAIGTSLSSCGTLTKCQIVTATPAVLAQIFTDGAGNFRDMSSLLTTQLELKMCGARVNGLYDLLMANAKPMGKLISKQTVRGGYDEIQPFILASQKSIINAEFWEVIGSTGSTTSATFYVINRNAIELDPQWFVVDNYIYIASRTAGGSSARTAWQITQAVASTFAGTSVLAVTATGRSSASYNSINTTNVPTRGVLVRGTNNINDFEQWCHNRPALNPNKRVPFWIQTSRYTLCSDQLYEETFARLIKNNEYFRIFGDVPMAERNRQLGEIAQREWLNSFFWNTRINANQTLSNYRSLPEIDTYASGDLYLPGSEGRCVGFRANAVGVYEQLLECDRVYDLQGQVLNLLEFFDQIYQLIRNRDNMGSAMDTHSVDILTDSTTAYLFELAMIDYYKSQYGSGTIQVNVTPGSMAELGMKWNSYKLLWPQGVTLNIISHFYFDDLAAAATTAGMEGSGRFMFILDWPGIYPGIVGSNRKQFTSGALNDLARIDEAFACVMERPTSTVTLNSTTWTAVVECPANNLILENFASIKPVSTGRTGPLPYDLYSTY